MKTLFQGFGIAVFKHRDGTYSMRENGYHSGITYDHARALSGMYGFKLPPEKKASEEQGK